MAKKCHARMNKTLTSDHGFKAIKFFASFFQKRRLCSFLKKIFLEKDLF